MLPINKISAPRVMENLGKSIQRSPNLKAIGKAFEMNGVNFKSGPFLGLMFGAVMIPRLIQAKKRDNGTGDEIREIFTRDLISILTLVLALKGLKSGFASSAAKKNGLVLLDKSDAGMSLGKKLIQYFKPANGINALNSEQIASKYGKFESNEEFMRFLKEYIAVEGGNLEKVLMFGKRKGSELSKHTQSIFPEGLKDLKPEAIIEKIKNSGGVDKYREILNNPETNPILKYAQRVNGWLEAASLATVTGFLGFGLPKLNNMLTNKKYLGKDGMIKVEYEDPSSLPFYTNPVRSLTKAQKMAFSNFLGHRADYTA